jgi:hypothetical protein
LERKKYDKRKRKEKTQEAGKTCLLGSAVEGALVLLVLRNAGVVCAVGVSAEGGQTVQARHGATTPARCKMEEVMAHIGRHIVNELMKSVKKRGKKQSYLHMWLFTWFFLSTSPLRIQGVQTK